MLKTLAHSLPIGYQDSDNHFINQELSNIVPGLSRRKQGFDSPWGYLFYKELWRFDFENEPKSRGKNVGTFFL